MAEKTHLSRFGTQCTESGRLKKMSKYSNQLVELSFPDDMKRYIVKELYFHKYRRYGLGIRVGG